MIYLRVGMVWPAGKDYYFFAKGACLFGYLHTPPANFIHVFFTFGESRSRGLLYIPYAYIAKISGQYLMKLFWKVLFPVYAYIVVNERYAVLHAHVGCYNLGIIGNNRAVIVVVAKIFVKIEAHARVENMFKALLFHKVGYVPMQQLCRKAYCIAGNCGLSLYKNIPVGKRGYNNLKTKLCKESMPEHCHFIHV